MTPRQHKPSAGAAHGGGELPPRSALRWSLLLTGLLLALAARISALLIAPQDSYLPDHISNMGWSTYAFQHGPWRVYELPANQPLVVRVGDPRSGRVGETVRLNAHACNYPPLSIYLFWLQGAVWHALDPREVTARPSPALVRRFGVRGPVTSRVVDTPASRFADALPGIICDFLLAWGVAALVGRLRPKAPPGGRQLLAFFITLLAPPIFLDSAFWNQADSWVSCLLVWCLVFLLRERLPVAGLLYGAALMTKPQAILFAPVLLYIFAALRFMPGGSWRRALALWKAAAAALLVVALLAAPFVLHDARDPQNPDGALRWFKRSYLGTIGSARYNQTTLVAFNLWWLDLLAREAPAAPGELRRLLDADRPLLGVSKATFGKALLVLSIVLTWVLCARKWSFRSESWPVCAFLVLLAAFVLPTGVHERYVYYCLPFLIALAAHRPAWSPPLLALLLVGTFEMTSFRWVGLWSGELFRPGNAARPLSGVLAALTVLSLLYSYAVLLPRLKRLPAS